MVYGGNDIDPYASIRHRLAIGRQEREQRLYTSLQQTAPAIRSRSGLADIAALAKQAKQARQRGEEALGVLGLVEAEKRLERLLGPSLGGDLWEAFERSSEPDPMLLPCWRSASNLRKGL